MTDELINTLSREYAKECIDPCGFSKDTYEELVDEKAEDMECKLQWLSSRYYLVEKVQVKEKYNHAMQLKQDGDELDHCLLSLCGLVKESLLTSLFPEIAKEVKND